MALAARRLFPWLALALFAAAAAFLHVAGIGGAFLADDFSHLDVVSREAARSNLGAWTLARFHEPLGNGSFAYRPLAFASYALDWIVHGDSAPGWRTTSLLLHAANALLAGLVVARWLRGRGAHAAPAAIVAGCTLFAFPFAGEITYWLAGRFDLLACLFTLLFLAALPLDRRSTLPQHVWRIAFLAGALAAKESAIPLALVATLLAFACGTAGDGRDGVDARRGVRFAAAEIGPAWLLTAGYLLFRTWLFGTPTRVYPDLPPAQGLVDFGQRLAGLGTVARANAGDHFVAWALLALVALAAVAWTGVRSRQRIPRRTAALMLSLLAAAALYLVAPALSLPVFTPDGEGARHVYLAFAYAALLTGLAVAWGPWHWLPGLAFAAVMLAGQAASLGQWQAAGRTMQALVAGVPAVAARIGDDQYALLLVPDHIGVALFGRTAQDAIVIPPTQRRNYLDRMAGMLGTDFAVWSKFVADGKVAELKGRAAFDPKDFVGVFCWNPARGAFVPLASGDARDAGAWQAEAQRNFARAGCLAPF